VPVSPPGQTITDPAHIEVYVTPYYNSKGPAIDVGPFSGGLAAKNEPEFVATIAKMKSYGRPSISQRRTSPRFVCMIWVSGKSQFTGFIRLNIAAVFLRVSSIATR
jgi:hypothetical protein